MVAGAPFPDFYDWTWGELQEFIICKNEARTNELRENANMYFSTVMLMTKTLSAKKNTEFSVAQAYPYLWTQEEHKKMEEEKVMRQLMAMTRPQDKKKYGYKG